MLSAIINKQNCRYHYISLLSINDVHAFLSSDDLLLDNVYNYTNIYRLNKITNEKLSQV